MCVSGKKRERDVKHLIFQMCVKVRGRHHLDYQFYSLFLVWNNIEYFDNQFDQYLNKPNLAVAFVPKLQTICFETGVRILAHLFYLQFALQFLDLDLLESLLFQFLF